MALLQPPVVSAPASDDVVARLDEDLRAAVRRDGIDPQGEAPAVRRLATALVRDHDERSLTGVVAPVADPEALVAELVARVAGFGPLQPLLDDPSVEEVWINSPDRVFIARNGRHELTNLVLTEGQVTELVERMLKSTGRRIDISRPFVDAMLPAGHRLHVVLQGISRGFSAVNFGKQAVARKGPYVPRESRWAGAIRRRELFWLPLLRRSGSRDVTDRSSRPTVAGNGCVGRART